MLSLILTCFEPTLSEAKRQEGVVRSLASLVPFVVEGIVADAALIGPHGAGLEAIADEAGCALIEAAEAAQGLAAALARARFANVLLLSAGYAVQPGFGDAARELLAFGGFAQARVLRLEPNSVLTRLSPAFAEPVGVLATKEALLSAGSASPGAIARRLRPAEIFVTARRAV
ncbi:MAG TPA: transposase [Methylocystis sp.]|nr:transposase [Methylocystis sp.]